MSLEAAAISLATREGLPRLPNLEICRVANNEDPVEAREKE